MAGLHFDIAGNNADIIRKLKETQKAFEELGKNAENQGRNIDSVFDKVSFGDTLKKQIYEGAQAVNGLTEKIIHQRKAVREITQDVNTLNEAYKRAGRDTDKGKALLVDLNNAKESLKKEKAALFDLQTQQAQARLSVRRLKDEYALYQKEGQNVIDANNRMALSFKKTLAAIGGTAMIKKLISDVVQVRGQFQQLEIAFETMLKSKDKASALMGQLTETAAKTPFDLQGIAQGAKQLLAYGTAAEDVNDTLVRLGNIASGLSIPLNDLVWLYGTTQTQGRLFTQDVRQFMGRGIPLVKELAKELGKTEQQINEMVTAGKIGFPEVEKVIRNMTNEGGQFYNLMEKQSASLTGQISNLGDAWDMMLNKIGAQTQGIASAGISTVTSLIENYEEVGRILIGLIGTYGVARTAIALTALENGKYIFTLSKLTTALKASTIAQKALNLAVLKNPYVIVAVAVGTLITTLWSLHDSTTAAEKAQKHFNERQKEAQKQEQEHKQKIDSLVESSRDIALADLQRGESLAELRKEYPKIFAKYDIESIKLADILKLKRQIAEEDNKRANVTDQEQLRLETLKLREYEQRKKEGVVLIDIDGNGWGETNIDDAIKAQLELVDKAKARVAQYGVNSYLSGIKNLASSDITSTIQDITLSLQALGKSGDDAIAVVASLGGEFSKAQLNAIKAALETEQKVRSGEKKSGGDWVADAKKEYEKALSDLKTFETNKTQLTKEEYERRRKELKDKADIAEKKYKDLGGITGSALTKQENQAKREAEKKLQQQQKLSDDLLSLHHKNQQEEIDLMEEGKKRKLKQIDADFAAQKTAIQKKSREFAEANKKAGITGLNANGLTAEQQAEIDKANKLNADSRAKAETDMYKAEAEAMRNYLKEYGTFQQQKLAIAEEYAEKIRKAQSEGERLSLAKQRDAALVNIDVQAAQQNIDWQSIFGDLGMMLREQIQPTIDNLKTIIQSDEFQSSSVEDRQKIYDILSRLEQQSGALGNGLFKEVAMDLEIYRNSLEAYNKARQREIEATNRLIEAKNRLKLAQENGGDVDAAKQAVEEAQTAFNQASESVKALGDKASENAQTLKTSSEKARGAIEGLASGLSKLKSGSLQQAFEGIKGIGSTLGGKLGDAISNIDPTGIISGVLGLLDVLKDGVSTIFVSLQDTLFGAVEGILNDVLSGDIVTKTWSNAMSHVGNILNTVTFGGFNSLFGIGGNAKKVQEAIDRMTDRNETLEKSIDRLSDVMEKEAGSKSISAYEQAYKYQEEHNKNTLQIAREQAGYHNSHKSWQYYMKWDDEQLQWARDNVDKNFSGTNSLWGLTPEQMKMLLSNADIYDHMKNTGAGGYGGRVMEKLEAYADNAEKLDELTGRINESLMQVSFDSLRDSFLDSLMDMDKDAKGFSEDFSEYMQRALLNFSMGEMFDEDLKEWYDGIAKLMKEQGGELTKTQLEDARTEYDRIVKDALNERDKLAQITGYTGGKDEDSEDGRKAAQKGIATASQDSIDELKGTMTNVQGHTYSINENTARIATGINTLTEHTKHLTCLADIDNTMQSLLTMRKESIEHLSNIAEYTSNLVEMKEFMRSMKAGIDTLNTKGLTLKR